MKDDVNKSSGHTEFDLPGEWRTVPAESDQGGLIMVTGRTDISKFRDNPRFNIRVTISWRYGEQGMPDNTTSALMETVTERLASEFYRDPVAVLTGLYTGDGQRDWIFYTLSLNIFGRKLNELLADLPLLPLEISAESDPEWLEFGEMTRAIE